VSTFVDQAPDAAGRYGAALLFVAWAEGTTHPVGHLETGYLEHGRTPEEAVAPLLALTLREVKAHLDRAVASGGRPAS
jgi:hypothetical protein